MLLGLFLYTGLARRNIFDLQKASITQGSESRYAIWIMNDDGEHKIPVSKKLDKILDMYTDMTKDIGPRSKVFDYSQDTAISSRVSTLTKQITGNS